MGTVDKVKRDVWTVGDTCERCDERPGKLFQPLGVFCGPCLKVMWEALLRELADGGRDRRRPGVTG